MPLKKGFQDVANRGIITLRTHIPVPIHKPIAIHEDSTSIKGKSIRDSTNENSSIDDQTPNKQNQNSLYRFSFIESIVIENFKIRP